MLNTDDTARASVTSLSTGLVWTVTAELNAEGDVGDDGRAVSTGFSVDYLSAACPSTGEAFTFDDGTDEALTAFAAALGLGEDLRDLDKVVKPALRTGR